MDPKDSPSQPFPLPKSILLNKLRSYLEEDVGFGDITTSIIPATENGQAKIFAKSNGILAGLEEAALLFEDNGIIVKKFIHDGENFEKGDLVMELSGNLRSILMVERTALDFLMKLSSIASSTHELVSLLRDQDLKTILAATRKTTPGFAYFEKKAVFLGGGDPHRWNLSDMVLLKDTHLKRYNGNIAELLKVTRELTSFSKKIEVEIENPTDFKTAVEFGADIVMMDNMSPAAIQKTLSEINIPSHVLVEASGNITHETLIDYARSGVDIISTSSIIFHPHVKSDFSLRLM
ncbi:MAG: carboxylating nicotinate-nucleotide diphosphorylase [Promethearchaeia archaeon]|nr:MAG: carboxylating nicotinate-nucleotide diphosphorylase [Candidatus Lokiarchaeia archaeon]